MLAADNANVYICVASRVFCQPIAPRRPVEKLFDVESFKNHVAESSEVKGEENVEKVPEKSEADKSGNQEIQILCCCLSRCGSNLAVGCSNKRFYVWDIAGSRVSKVFDVPKAPTSCCFDKDGSHLVLGDRAGDVLRRRLQGGPNELLAGCVSMVLDVLVSDDGRRLVTADRDEKVRVCRYPQSFVIETFCLGHASYVKSLASRGNLCWSAGGDGVILEWNMAEDAVASASEPLQHDGATIKKLAALQTANGVLVGAAIDGQPTFVVCPEGMSSAERVALPATALDVATIGDDRFAVLTRVGLVLVDAQLAVDDVQLDDDVVAKLAAAVEPLGNLAKNVTFNNLEQYNKTKMEKLEARKAQKRKHETTE